MTTLVRKRLPIERLAAGCFVGLVGFVEPRGILETGGVAEASGVAEADSVVEADIVEWRAELTMPNFSLLQFSPLMQQN
jgi:hypothetical protein